MIATSHSHKLNRSGLVSLLLAALLVITMSQSPAATAQTQAPPPTIKPMAADADPSFDVATIKPSNSDGATIQGLGLSGRNFAAKNASLVDLIGFAYNVQAKQIAGAPDWMEKDRYDVSGVPDKEGTPSLQQLAFMMRKLLAERFHLTFHQEKRQMPAYVLTSIKSQKLSASKRTGEIPDFGLRPAPNGLALVVGNAQMIEFAGFLQVLVVDRPVVDRTGIPGRFDFQVAFTPDNSQFNGRPPRLPPLPDTVVPAPSLFVAVQEQLGLKLSPEKAPVDILTIDHVEKPNAN